MAYIEVDVDIDDHLDDASTTALQQELRNRQIKELGEAFDASQIKAPNVWAIIEEAATTLRNQGFNALAFKLDEIRNGQVI